MTIEQDSDIQKTEEQQNLPDQVSARLKRSSSETGIYSVDAPGVDVNSLMQAKHDEGGRSDVTAATVARMMGVATASELKLVEGKIDLLTAKLAGFGVRLEKIVSMLNSAPTGADLERIDVQIGALKAMVKDTLAMAVGEAAGGRGRDRHSRGERGSETKPEVEPPGGYRGETSDK